MPMRLTACHDCGLISRLVPLPAGTRARCRRCGGLLARSKPHSIEHSHLLGFAALILFGLSNGFPFLTLRIEGRAVVSTLFTGVRDLFAAGMAPLAGLVFAASILFPLLKLLGLLYVTVPLGLGRRPAHAPLVFRASRALRPWAMTDVYLLGVLVAYVELSGLGQLDLGTAAFAFACLILIMVAIEASLDPQEVWERLERHAPSAGQTADVPSPGHGVEPGSVVDCHACRRLHRLPSGPGDGHRGVRLRCRRCGAGLHAHKPDSLSTTWALLITAAILYVPANVYPVMTVISFGRGEPDTILSGVTHLIEGGQWPLAALVFFASVAVPVLKLVGLSYLLVSVQRGSRWRPRDRTRLYRLIEGVGRWSMIDVFMISILVGLVQLGAIATIEPGVGATAFAAVVVTTMIASASFDPRLIWRPFDLPPGSRP